MLKKSSIWLLVLCLIVSVFAISAFANESVQYPDAEVTVMSPITLTPEEHDYMCWPSGDSNIDRPLQIVMNFKANDTLEEAIASGYGDWKCDFYLTFNGLANGNVTADNCYLAGNYGEFGWIVIPTDGLVIDEGISYPVVSAYDANLTYENICDYVKDFTAAIYIDNAILEANPEFEVSLELKMTDPDNENNVITIGEPAVYDVKELTKPNADVSVLDPTVLTEEDDYLIYDGSLHDGVEDLPLQVVMNFKAQDSLAAAKASKYGKWICDFYLTFKGADGTFSTKDCYLAGNYGSFGWIAIPAEALAPELEYNVAYPVVAAYDPNLTYENICDYVKDFTAAIYISPALLEANPEFEVSLELRMTNPENADDYLVVGEPAVFGAEDLHIGLQKGNDINDLESNTQIGGTIDVEANTSAIESAKEELVEKFPALTEEQVANATVEIEIVFESLELVEGSAPASYSYTVSPMLGVGDSKIKVTTFDAPVTFRLPVHSLETKTCANVYHNGDLIGKFDIQSEGGELFVEVSSKDFSTFTVEPVEDIAALAEVDGKKFATVAEALQYAIDAGITDLVLTLVGETDEASAWALQDAFDLCYNTSFNSVTFKQADASTPYYIYDLYTGSRVGGGEFVFDGVNLVVVDQYMFEGNVRLTNNSIVKSVAEANCFLYYSTTVVDAGSKLYGVIDDFRGGDLIIDGGRADGEYNVEADYQSSILTIRWGGDSLTIKNGAYVKLNASNEIGRTTITTNTSLNVSDSKLESWEYIENNGTINVDTESVISTGRLYGNGAIVIDASGLKGRVTVIESKDLAGFTGTITLTGNDKAKYEITENGLEVFTPLTVDYTNVTLTENFKMSFAFLQSFVADWTDYYVVITKTSANDGSEETIVVPAEQWKSTTIGEAKYYVVEYAGIAAKEMSDVVAVTVYNADDAAVSETTTDSIKDYAMRKLSHSAEDAKLATLLVDMLNYGAEAQTFFGYATDKLANADLSDEQKAFASEGREYSDEAYGFAYAEGYSFPAANTLILDYNVQLKVGLDLRALELSDGAKIIISYVNYKGETVTNEVSVKDYDYKSAAVYASCDTLTARDFGAQVEFKLVDGETEIFTFTNSIESFTARLADGNNKVDICSALMKYGDSAAAYFNN